jgi:amino acid permease
MKRTFRILTLIFGLSLLYLIIINLVYLVFVSSTINNIIGNYSEDGNVRIGVGDSISVEIIKNRFYGYYYISGEKEILYFLDYIKIPMEINGYSIKIIHLFFIIYLIYLYYELAKENIYKD